jgi:hypothetical protein
MSSQRDEARAARGQIETALDAIATSSGWPWRPRVSAWLDVLTLIEEAAST